jgi:hypothetical protein
LGQEGGLRPRAATHPVRLEPAATAELLALARNHDEKIKELRQDLFRAETKLYHHSLWRWPVRFAFLTAGVLGVLAWQNERIRTGVITFCISAMRHVREGGVETLVGMLIAGVVVAVLMFVAHRLIRGPTPEQRARKLMRQFAEADGVAAYVFTAEDTTEGEASLVNALLRPGSKKVRQRRLTQDHRSMVSTMTQLLNQNIIRMDRVIAAPHAAEAEPAPAVHSDTG